MRALYWLKAHGVGSVRSLIGSVVPHRHIFLSLGLLDHLQYSVHWYVIRPRSLMQFAFIGAAIPRLLPSTIVASSACKPIRRKGETQQKEYYIKYVGKSSTSNTGETETRTNTIYIGKRHGRMCSGVSWNFVLFFEDCEGIWHCTYSILPWRIGMILILWPVMGQLLRRPYKFKMHRLTFLHCKRLFLR